MTVFNANEGPAYWCHNCEKQDDKAYMFLVTFSDDGKFVREIVCQECGSIQIMLPGFQVKEGDD